MRAEDIVDSGFMVGILSGISLSLYGMGRAKGSRERSQLICGGLAVVGFVLVAFGLGTLYLIHTSARPVIEGYIWGVNEPVRSGSGGNSFRVTYGLAQQAYIQCEYDGPGLRTGDRARAHYVAYNNKLLDLTILTGSYTGWHLQESSGQLGTAVFAAFGPVFLFAAYRQWRRYETGSRPGV